MVIPDRVLRLFAAPAAIGRSGASVGDSGGVPMLARKRHGIIRYRAQPELCPFLFLARLLVCHPAFRGPVEHDPIPHHASRTMRAL